MRKNVLACLLVAAALCLVSSGLYAAHSDYGCADCHQPHRVWDADAKPTDYGVPLYSSEVTKDSPAEYEYTLYSSYWFDLYGVTPNQPTGASRLCLGCHDGTYGYVRHEFVNKTADLANSHPISINYEAFRTSPRGLAKNDLYTPSTNTLLNGTIAATMLDQNGDVQCISCHDVHTTGKTEFLLKFEPGDGNKDLCRTCHIK